MKIILVVFFFSHREFLMNLQSYKSFFSGLPEELCHEENAVDESTCWSREGVVER